MKKFNFVEPSKIKIDKYPDVNSVYEKEGDDTDGYKDFFSYKDGYDVEDDNIQRWVNSCVESLLDNPDEKYSYICGGNTLVVATINEEEISVFVSKSHMNAVIPLHEPTYFNDEETV